MLLSSLSNDALSRLISLFTLLSVGSAALVIWGVRLESASESADVSYPMRHKRGNRYVIIGLAAETICTIFIALPAKMLESRQELEVAQLSSRTAAAVEGAARVEAENLALQQVIQDRVVPLGSPLDPFEPTLRRFAQLPFLSQSVSDDREAKNLMENINRVLNWLGWQPKVITESQTGVSSFFFEGVELLTWRPKGWPPGNQGEAGIAADHLMDFFNSVGVVTFHRSVGVFNGKPNDPRFNFNPPLDAIVSSSASSPKDPKR